MRTLVTGGLTALTVAIGGALFLTNGPEAHAEEVMLYKNPQCGCCEGHAQHLRENGYDVTVKPTHDLAAMSEEAGIPEAMQGCHLALVNGYAVGGHVPASIIDRLLAERPDVRAITLPGMPLGSPGMGGTKQEPFAVYAVGEGEPQVYAVE